MTDISKYKNITVPLETYELITKVAETGFDVQISRSKAVVHIFNIWTGTDATIKPKPQQSNLQLVGGHFSPSTLQKTKGR